MSSSIKNRQKLKLTNLFMNLQHMYKQTSNMKRQLINFIKYGAVFQSVWHFQTKSKKYY